MKIFVRGTFKPEYVASKTELDCFAGHAAGVCYMANDYDNILKEPIEKTIKRADNTKINGHHSVYDHEYISLELRDIPKALAMVINNEHNYTTSEKSARYTKMVLDDKSQKLYDKWLEIFKNEIAKKYQDNYPNYFTKSRIEKLAQENARYLISVFTPTSLIYTISYRNLNYLYQFLIDEINNENSNKFYNLLKPAMEEFCFAIQTSVPYLDAKLMINGKNRSLKLYNEEVPEEYFGSVYATNYKGSLAQLAQAQRHRTLDYSMCLLDNDEFYVPPIIEKNEELVKEWINDCNENATEFPQGLMVNINEMGSLDNFILKMMERKCSVAQLEINRQTTETLNKYYNNLKERNSSLAQKLEPYTHGARCTFPNFICPNPCGFKEGINEEREI